MPSVKLKEMLETKASLYGQMRQMTDTITKENREFTAEEHAKFDKIDADYSANLAALQKFQRVEELASHNVPRIPEGRFAPSDPAQRSREQVATSALAGWILGPAKARPEQLADMQSVGLSHSPEMVFAIGGTSNFNQRRDKFLSTPPGQRRGLAYDPQSASLLTSSATAAGNLIGPGSLGNSFDMAMLEYGGVLQEAEVIRTANGESFHWPSANDTGNKGEMLAEVADIGSSVNPSIGRTTLGAYKMSSKVIRYSAELYEDSAFDLVSMLFAMAGERIGRIIADYLTTGTGSSQPQGVVTGAHAGVTAAAVAAITADEVIDLFHSLDPAYRANAKFMANDSTFKLLRKLKASGSGDYIWRAGGVNGNISDGFTDYLFGKPAIPNQSMAAAAASAVSLLLGDFSKVKVRQVNEVRVRRMTELYAQTDEEGIVAFVRVDSKVLNAGTNPIKKLTQAAA